MRLFRELEQINLSGPVALTIGNFDGVHLGHQGLIAHLNQLGTSLAVTFSNHPSTLLAERPTPQITTLPHKLALLEQAGLKALLLLPFTEALSKLSAAEFLTLLKRKVPFTHLLGGEDAAFGHKRQVDFQALEQQLHFTSLKRPLLTHDGNPITSQVIRSLISKGLFDEAALFLGRPYTLRGTVVRGSGKGRLLGFRTANVPLTDLCIPPTGVYIAEVSSYKGLVNIGTAPTLHEGRALFAEVHLLDCEEDFYDREIEIYFKRFLRPEKRFASIDALKEQIAEDICAVQTLN